MINLEYLTKSMQFKMNSRHINNIAEEEYYNEIITFFSDSSGDLTEIVLWISKQLINLMNILKNTNNKALVQNCILLMLSLYVEKDISNDSLFNNGIKITDLSQNEKDTCITCLKNEFMNSFK